MFYQLYNIHLLNGEVIQSAEDYDLPAEKGLVGMFERMKETDILTVNDLLLGSAYIPKRSIVYIATGDVTERSATIRRQCSLDCLCDSSFFLPAPAWWQWDSISCSSHMSARKPYRGCAFWEPHPLQLSALSNTTE